MKRWSSIEGLRAWLAVTVILHHCVQVAALPANFGWSSRLYQGGPIAVYVFIIISGFVITHLIRQGNDAYFPYLTRRFMRIYPLFCVTCVAGALTQPLLLQGVSKLPWPSVTALAAQTTIDSLDAHPFLHFIAHATMMHGVIPDSLLPASAVEYLGPAWSLSVEWQFYLIAPLALLLAQRKSGAIGLIIVSWIGCYCFMHGKFGSYLVLSFLPAVAPYFALGAFSRIALPKIHATNPAIVAALCLSLAPLGESFGVPVLIWIAFFVYLCGPRPAAFDAVFASRLATFWGERSYSIYLTHGVVLNLVVYLTCGFARSNVQYFIMITMLTVVGTAIVSMITYVVIERPGMALGSAMASRIARKSYSQSREPDRNIAHA
jgi:peptidoglycan/LPS O-acetylase OafA/YrhL